jgi:hypothetical protein
MSRDRNNDEELDFISEPFITPPKHSPSLLPNCNIQSDHNFGSKPLPTTLKSTGEYKPLKAKLRYKILLPTLAVFILTAGLGIAIVAWLFTRRKISIAEAFQLGYILVDEDVKYSGGMESATLRALIATSFIVSILCPLQLTVTPEC